MGDETTDVRALRATVLALAEQVGLPIEGRQTSEPGPVIVDLEHRRYITAKAWVRANGLLKRSFDDDTMFSNPAWNILLDLYVSRWEGRSISVSSATLASAVPGTTGLRYLTYLQGEGMIQRRDHPKDRRIVYVDLTEAGMQRVAHALDAVTESNERLGIGHLRLVK